MSISVSFCLHFYVAIDQAFSTQTASLLLIQRWEIMLDNKGYAGAVLMDLSKAFNTINYGILAAKLHTNGFSKEALKLLLSYLKHKKQRVMVNTIFSCWADLICGVSQCSVLGPVLFYIFLDKLFFLLNDTQVSNFPDDTTPFVCGQNLAEVVKKLEENSDLATNWF